MPDAAASPPRAVELLAPAGNHRSLVAAVRAGADAVYLGLREFNARRGADNFDLEGLREACDFAHLRGCRVYLTANVLVLPDEMPDALSLVDDAWAAGVDAVIVQDLGLARIIRQSLPDVRLHASTQLGAHNRETVELLARLGFDRVTLARELCFQEIGEIAGSTSVEVETFVHGALCACYSGQCLMGSLVGGRSANRGLCSQPCRLPYRLVSSDGLATDTSGPYLLSPKDLAGIARLPEYLEAGVSALKIEGRMKTAEYVALVTGTYRDALDRALEDPHAYVVTDGEWEVLEEAFNRGFTDAYLDGDSGEELMARSRPNNRGVQVGRVTATDGGRVTVLLERALETGDRVEFWTTRGRFAQEVSGMMLGGARVDVAPAGIEVSMPVDGRPFPGDRIFRVESASLMAAARRVVTRRDEPRPVPVAFRVDVQVGRPLRVTASVEDMEVFAEGATVERARTKPIGADEIVEQVGRLGGTPYAAASWDIRVDADAGLGYSALHRARRDAIHLLDEHRLAASHSRSPRRPRLAPLPTASTRSSRVALVAAVADRQAAAACKDAGADLVLLRMDSGAPLEDLGEDVLPRLARIARGGEVAGQLRWTRGDGACIGNIGVLARAAEDGAGLHADWPVGVTNPHTARVLADLGVEFLWLSPELNMDEVALLAAGSPVPVGVSVLGRQELMVLEHCIVSLAGECASDCGSCRLREQSWGLEDRREYRFPVWSDESGRSHLANAVALDVTRSIQDLAEAGVAAIRLDLEIESLDEARRLTAAVRSRLDEALSGSPAPESRLVEPATGGHFFRGVR